MILPKLNVLIFCLKEANLEKFFHATCKICKNFAWKLQNLANAAAFLFYKILNASWKIYLQHKPFFIISVIFYSTVCGFLVFARTSMFSHVLKIKANFCKTLYVAWVFCSKLPCNMPENCTIFKFACMDATFKVSLQGQVELLQFFECWTKIGPLFFRNSTILSWNFLQRITFLKMLWGFSA